MRHAFLWWALLTAIGWATFPLVSRFYRSPISGYALSRPIGLLILSLSIWLPCATGLLDFTRTTVWIVILLLFLASLWRWKRQWFLLKEIVRQSWKSFILIEILFSISGLAYLLFRARLPVAAHTEQPMDLAILSSLLRHSAMPPPDPWLSGHTLNYYYGGYLQIAILSKALSVTPGIAYTLGLVQTLSLTVTSLFGLLSSILHNDLSRKGRLRISTLGSLAIVMIGTPGSVLQLASARGLVPRVILEWLKIPVISSTDTYWWWFSASRIAQDTNIFGRNPVLITEFPAFSFLLGDLHPHLMGLPVFISGLALCLALAQKVEKPLRKLLISPLLWVTCAVLAAAFITNSWDLPTLLLVLFLALISRSKKASFGQTLGSAMYVTCLTGSGALLLAMPFLLHLETPTGGIDISYYAFSEISLYILMFSTWLLPFTAVSNLKGLDLKKIILNAAIILCALVASVLLIDGPASLMLSAIGLVGGGWLWIILWLLLAFTTTHLMQAQSSSSLHPEYVLLIAALVISLLAEWFFLRDLFITRMNTVFKVYYQVWILLSVAGITVLSKIVQNRGWKRCLAGVTGAMLLLSFTYTGCTAFSRLGQESVPHSIDGLNWLQQHHSDEYVAIQWLRENAAEDDVLIEAWGDEYNANESRFSASTGISSVLGWYGHEVQWRGRQKELVQRRTDIDRLYQSPSLEEKQEILEKYSIDWIIAGTAEREKYALTNTISLWDGLAELAYASGEVEIYQIQR